MLLLRRTLPLQQFYPTLVLLVLFFVYESLLVLNIKWFMGDPNHVFLEACKSFKKTSIQHTFTLPHFLMLKNLILLISFFALYDDLYGR